MRSRAPSSKSVTGSPPGTTPSYMVPWRSETTSGLATAESSSGSGSVTTSRQVRRPSSRARRATYWLITRDASRHLDVFTVDYGGDETLVPVFSSKEEAQLFAEKQFMKGGWHARPTSIGELVSVLYGPCRR